MIAQLLENLERNDYSEFPPPIDSEIEESILPLLDLTIKRSRVEENSQLELSVQLLKCHTMLQSGTEPAKKILYQIEGIIGVHLPKTQIDVCLKYYYYCLTGLLRMKEDDVMGAVESFSNAYAISSGLTSAERIIYYLGVLYTQLKEYNMAISYFLEGADTVPDGGEVQHQFNLQLGSVYYIRGHYRIALWYFFKSVNSGFDNDNVLIHEKICLCYILQGELELAKYYLAQINSSHTVKVIPVLLSAMIKVHEGSLEGALSLLKEVRTLDLDTMESIAVKKTLGEVFLLKGELDEAEKCLKGALHLSQEINNNDELVGTLQALGKLYYHRGDYDQSTDYLLEAFNLSLKVNLRSEMISSLYLFLQLKIIQKKVDLVEYYLEIMRNVSENMENAISTYKFLLVKALWLESQDRLIPQADAQKILRELNDREIADFELRFLCKLRLVENLITELASFDSKVIYEETTEYISDLLKSSKNINSPLYLIEGLFIKCKIKIYNLDFEDAFKILTQISIACEENSYSHFHIRIQTLRNEISKYVELSESTELTRIKDAIRLTEIDDYIRLVFT